ncbi:hypothetical protein GBA52_013773, partial [Prunus armeniaca]
FCSLFPAPSSPSFFWLLPPPTNPIPIRPKKKTSDQSNYQADHSTKCSIESHGYGNCEFKLFSDSWSFGFLYKMFR